MSFALYPSLDDVIAIGTHDSNSAIHNHSTYNISNNNHYNNNEYHPYNTQQYSMYSNPNYRTSPPEMMGDAPQRSDILDETYSTDNKYRDIHFEPYHSNIYRYQQQNPGHEYRQSYPKYDYSREISEVPFQQSTNKSDITYSCVNIGAESYELPIEWSTSKVNEQLAESHKLSNKIDKTNNRISSGNTIDDNNEDNIQSIHNVEAGHSGIETIYNNETIHKLNDDQHIYKDGWVHVNISCILHEIDQNTPEINAPSGLHVTPSDLGHSQNSFQETLYNIGKHSLQTCIHSLSTCKYIILLGSSALYYLSGSTAHQGKELPKDVTSVSSSSLSSESTPSVDKASPLEDDGKTKDKYGNTNEVSDQDIGISKNKIDQEIITSNYSRIYSTIFSRAFILSVSQSIFKCGGFILFISGNVIDYIIKPLKYVDNGQLNSDLNYYISYMRKQIGQGGPCLEMSETNHQSLHNESNQSCADIKQIKLHSYSHYTILYLKNSFRLLQLYFKKLYNRIVRVSTPLLSTENINNIYKTLSCPHLLSYTSSSRGALGFRQALNSIMLCIQEIPLNSMGLLIIGLPIYGIYMTAPSLLSIFAFLFKRRFTVIIYNAIYMIVKTSFHHILSYKCIKILCINAVFHKLIYYFKKNTTIDLNIM